jgi:hypothetical protein
VEVLLDQRRSRVGMRKKQGDEQSWAEFLLDRRSKARSGRRCMDHGDK